MSKYVARNALLALLTLIPSLVYGQASIVGVVKDSSGAVLPGVTVEAQSPALIEAVRTAVTNGTGQYRIEQLRPGVYTLTFTLQGFNVSKREGVELTGSFTATVDAELRVGALQETLTVTGESPLVDVQNVRQQQVVSQELLAAVPNGRTALTTAALLPAVNLSAQDFGGVSIIGTNMSMTMHGSRAQDQRITIDGFTTMTTSGSGGSTNFIPDMGAAQEVTVDYAAGAAEVQLNAPMVNVIPKEGGNVFRGSFFGSGVTSGWQGSNLTQALRDRGLTRTNSIKHTYDINGGVGGPIAKNRTWFYASTRFLENENYEAGMYFNKNAGDITKWTYEPDLDRPGYSTAYSRGLNVRLTWQATSRNKFSFFHDEQDRCQCLITSALRSPEGASKLEYPPQRLTGISWTAPFTSRVLTELRVGYRFERITNHATTPNDPDLAFIPVVEQGGLIPGLLYRGKGELTPTGANQFLPFQRSGGPMWAVGGSLSYVTGAHAVKMGFTNVSYEREIGVPVDNACNCVYQFNNGVPNQIRQRATPYQFFVRQKYDLSIYAQDRWTVRRLTVNAGARFEHYDGYTPAQEMGPVPLAPTRHVSFPETQVLNFKDVMPRMGVAYDLFGDQKTALKLGLNKYVTAVGMGGIAFQNEAVTPFDALAGFVTRTWTDANGDFVPGCDLTNVLQQDNRASGGDFCGVVSNVNFGRAMPTRRSDPATDRGWGNRPYNWEFSTGIQRELLQWLSMDVGYFRRWYGNFTVLNDANLAPSDFAAFSVAVPLDSRLPNAGTVIEGFRNRNPDTLTRPADIVNEPAARYGRQTERWHGVDLTFVSRPRKGLGVQGGLSTGRTLTDNCEILAQIPEVNPLGLPFCRQQTDFLTQVKGIGVYEVPKVDVQVSASFQSLAGPILQANQVTPNAVVRPSLGRDLFGGAPNVTVGLVSPGALTGDRVNRLDFRVAKILNLGRARTLVGVELYNAFNSAAAITENQVYRNATLTGWRVPTSVLTARFVKLGVQLDF